MMVKNSWKGAKKKEMMTDGNLALSSYKTQININNQISCPFHLFSDSIAFLIRYYLYIVIFSLCGSLTCILNLHILPKFYFDSINLYPSFLAPPASITRHYFVYPLYTFTSTWYPIISYIYFHFLPKPYI